MQEAHEWAKFAEEDPSAEAIAEDLREKAATLLRDLKAIVPALLPLESGIVSSKYVQQQHKLLAIKLQYAKN
ncbi:MAG: hypothetical protein IPP17_00545 [Bacteroidetes bacterium]|nr:hypothetical protein [Bacteroidota bacterium]